MSFVDTVLLAQMIVEVAVSLQSNAPSYGSELHIVTDSPVKPAGHFLAESITTPAHGRYMIIQSPPSAMHLWKDSKTSLTLSTLHQGAVELGFGGDWHEGAQVRIDQLRPRW